MPFLTGMVRAGDTESRGAEGGAPEGNAPPSSDSPSAPPPASQQAGEAIAFVAPYCDLVDRLAVVPPSARVRGVFFRNVEARVSSLGGLSAFRSYFPERAYTASSFYPLGEYLVRLAVAGAIVASPERLHDGIFRIAQGNAAAFVESLLGRVMLRALARDPVRLAEQGVAARRQSFTYGQWELVRHGDRALEIVHRDEYVWLESEIAGAARGTFESCGIESVSTTLVDRFNGSTHVAW